MACSQHPSYERETSALMNPKLRSFANGSPEEGGLAVNPQQCLLCPEIIATISKGFAGFQGGNKHLSPLVT